MLAPTLGAEQRGRGPRRIDEMRLVAAGVGEDGALEPFGRQREIGVAGEIAGQELGEVDDHLGHAVLDRGQHLLVAGHHHVAAEHEVGGRPPRCGWRGYPPSARRCACGCRPRRPSARGPAMSSTPTPLPSRCAAMPRMPPMVTMPVPPTPVTMMS
jgi:hypothetical protein